MVAAIFIVAAGWSLAEWPPKKVVHVKMISSFDIQHVDALYDFAADRIDHLKVTTWTQLTYTMQRDQDGIHVQIRDGDDNLLTETTCGDFRIFYVPESWSPDQVQLQDCAPGEEIYTLGSIQ